jgi:glycosyltransferase involved in cell wall biosynthesis
MLEFMACGKAVILGVDGQARAILDEAQAGVFIEPEDVSALVAAVGNLYKDSRLRCALGENGRRYILKHFSRKHLAKTYSDILEKLVISGDLSGEAAL